MGRTKDKIQTNGPGRTEKETAWLTAIGLQAADGLRTSEYLWQIAQKNINGKIGVGEAKDQINGYYFERNAHDFADPEREEADKTAANITGILLSQWFDFSEVGLTRLHKAIFDGVYENAGSPRSVDVTNKEWVLGGDIASYLSIEALPGALEQCIAKERKYRYDGLSSDTLISHLVSFISNLWQICPFEEGNSRFTGVFTLLYLNYLGIDYKADAFKKDSWYFHNALVRANYRNIEKNIDFEPVYLERFFRNLLLSEQWDLRNRYVHVRPAAEWRTQSKVSNDTSTGQVQVNKNVGKVKEKEEKKVSKEDVKTEIKEKIDEIKPDSLPKRAKKSEKPEESIQDNPNILFLAVAIGEEFLSVKEIMERLHLKGRDSFLKLYLTPAVSNGIAAQLYPKAPQHPRQKYLLTAKGLDFLSGIGPEMRARIERHLAKERG
ncbi:MAG: Fic family protein [Bacteroidales bacterium]|nr:Fic family protein [Bacteroidales bacterium]